MNAGLTRGGALALLAALLALYYTALATHFTFELWPTTSGGFVFNSQLRALLDGRMDIDPRVIGMEGFVRDGKTYTYFGILPALLRLPLAGQLWRDWTTLSCVLASMLASLALLGSLAQATAGVGRQSPAAGLRLVLAASLITSGPQVELIGKPTVYMEAILWAYAFACCFLWASVPLLTGTGNANRRRLMVLAACAGLALLTRVSTGLGLYLALVLLLLVELGRRAPGAVLRRIAPAALVLAATVAAAGTVNALRWGNPLQFANLSANRYYSADAERLTRLADEGTFTATRIPYALAYYLAPTRFFAWPADSAPGQRIGQLFDGPEGPPFGIPAAQPLWVLLALVGGIALARRRAALDLPRTLALSTGLCAAIVVVCSYHYLAFRYRVEFAPLVVLLVLCGLRWLAATHWTRPATHTILAIAVLLGVLQTIQAHRAMATHACTPFGSYMNARLAAPECRFLSHAK